MGYLIAYLLLALAIDLLRELVNPTDDGSNAAAIRRRLWSAPLSIAAPRDSQWSRLRAATRSEHASFASEAFGRKASHGL